MFKLNSVKTGNLITIAILIVVIAAAVIIVYGKEKVKVSPAGETVLQKSLFGWTYANKDATTPSLSEQSGKDD